MIYKLLNKQAHSIIDVLQNRGMSDEHIKKYMQLNEDYICDYNTLGKENLKQAAAAILKTIQANKKAIIIVDSDADGFCSSAMLINYLHNYFPSWVEQSLEFFFHQGKQHGLEDCCDYILSNNFALVIAPDSASNDYTQHKLLKEKGITTVILDHHEAEKISDDAITINNQLSDYPNKFMCGGGIVWQFCRYMSTELFEDNKYLDFLDLTALSLISDMMDIKELETAYLIQRGILAENLKNPFIYYLSWKNSFSLGPNPTPIGWAFYITPFINSMMRSGTQEEKEILFKSMLTHYAYQMVPSTKRGAKGQEERLVEQAVRLSINVKNRQTKAQDEGMALLEKKIEENHLMENKVLVFLLEPNEIAPNLAGLAGNKIMAKYQRPCCVLTKNTVQNLPWESDEEFTTTYSGSARGCDLVGANNFKDVCSEFKDTIYAQGHQGAFGLSIPEQSINDFITYTNEVYKDIPDEPIYYVDAIWNGDTVPIDVEAIKDIAQYDNLWGTGLKEPIVTLEDIKITASMVTIYEKTTNTLKITLPNVTLMKFRISDEEYELFNNISPEGYIKVTFIGECRLNEFNGRVTPQIEIKDYDVLTISKYDF